MSPLDGEAKPYSKQAGTVRGKRRYHRDVAGTKRRQQIIDAKTGPCRVCAGSSGLTVTFHHLVPRSTPWHGSDTEANWVPLCGTGTTGCHGRIEARDPVASRLLAESLTDAEYSYAIQRGGEAFFERRYGIKYEAAA